VTVLTSADIGTQGTIWIDGVRVLARGRSPTGRWAVPRRAVALAATVREERPARLLVGDPAAHHVASYTPRLDAPYTPIFYGTELHAMDDRLGYRGGNPLRRLGQAVLRRYLTRADGAVCISRYSAGLLARVGVSVESPVIVHPSVSDVVLSRTPRPDAAARLRARLRWSADDVPVLLTVARISERKNQLGVLEALAHLHATTAYRYRYAIVGNVDADEHRDYRCRLEAFVQANGLTGSVGWIEHATDEEKTDYLDGCDVFAMLSRTVGPSAEGFGISVIEASCRGKPVLVSDQGGMPETIQEGQTGFAVSPVDAGAIARALGRLADAATRTRLGEAGRVFARAEFTPTASAERLREYCASRAASYR
jgi:glycosyltransferase involved in cell wall biosynthesis